MRSTRFRHAWLLLALLPLLGLSSCATSHLISWSRGRPSIWNQPSEETRPFLHPAGAILVFPVTVAWDVATFPFQWLWGVHPFGPTLGEDFETLEAEKKN